MDQLIVNFIELAVREKLIDELDKIYISNQLIELFNKKDFKKLTPKLGKHEQLVDVMEQMVKKAVQSKIIEDSYTEQDKLATQIMNLVTPLPSEVNKTFWSLYNQSPQQATDYFYQLGKQTNYIKTKEIAKNENFSVDSEFGTIELTINLSKPEKDPQKIKQLAQMTPSTYPVSALSFENEGYCGSEGQPARSNLRIIRLPLCEEEWGFQYSPYAYYKEHCIFLSKAEEPMTTSADTVKKLLEIVDKFPHYFVGCNAGLPIVGGSILNHNHYQGGRHVFPIEHAKVVHTFAFAKFPKVKGELLNWPMSVIRLESHSKEELYEVARKFFTSWENYSDDLVGIYSQTNGEQHNAITSIARKNQEVYHLYLILRNNRINAEYPDGIFHAHAEAHHIKKENIGLIEAMGLAILPPRLEKELKQVAHYILNQTTEVPKTHQKWADQLKQKYPQLSEENIEECIQLEVGEVFIQILKDAGVFKLNEIGKQAFLKFINEVIQNIDRD